MKKIFSMALVAMMMMTAVAAQDKRQDRKAGSKDRKEITYEQKQAWKEKMDRQRLEFLVKEMDLTEAEKEAFVPVYEMAQQEKKEAFEHMMNAYKALEEAVENPGEAAVADRLAAYLAAVEASQKIDTRYAEAYQKVIPSVKVAKLYLSEEKFRREQIQRLHRGGPQGGDRPQGRPGDRNGRRPQGGGRPPMPDAQ